AWAPRRGIGTASRGGPPGFGAGPTGGEGRDGPWMADGRREPDPLEATGDGTKALQGDGELDPSAIRRELMDFVDDDVFHVLQMALHELSGQNRLERLGSCNEDVRRSCSLLPAFGRRGVAMAKRRGQPGARDEMLNPINHVAIKSAQWGNVKGANCRFSTG